MLAIDHGSSSFHLFLSWIFIYNMFGEVLCMLDKLWQHHLRCKSHLLKQHCQFVDERSWMWTKEVCATLFIPHGSWPYEQWMQRCHMLNHVPLYTTWTYCRRWTPIGSTSCVNKHYGRLVIKNGRTLPKFKVLWIFLQMINDNFEQ